jgi:hypothetical protein
VFHPGDGRVVYFLKGGPSSSGVKKSLNPFYQPVGNRNKRMAGVIEYLDIIERF